MLRLAVFDLDGTLARPGASIGDGVSDRLRDLERRGTRIAIASGKNYEYLLRQAEQSRILNPLILAENGCVVFSRDPRLGPLASYTVRESSEPHLYLMRTRPAEAEYVQAEIGRRYGGEVWFQSNRVEVTIFPRDRSLIPKIARECSSLVGQSLRVISHDNAIDVIPSNIDKGVAVRRIQDVLQIATSETACVGNSDNDLPMFAMAASNYVVGDEVDFQGALHFGTIDEVLSRLLEGPP